MRRYAVGTLISIYIQELCFKREINSKASPLTLIQAILSFVTNNNQKGIRLNEQLTLNYLF